MRNLNSWRGPAVKRSIVEQTAEILTLAHLKESLDAQSYPTLNTADFGHK